MPCLGMLEAALAVALYFFFSPPAIVFLASVHNKVHNFVGFHFKFLFFLIQEDQVATKCVHRSDLKIK
jgi:hypothetical protein